ncbi:restriction endonuclease subunit S [Acinetobacter pseudolwoffii]|nr:restriction endonuclease subunit S [Acinetobacter pseudolwoffii]MCO8092204.1 restriction endonuclease subunit S [Acinetobacter pseudolwoffii]
MAVPKLRFKEFDGDWANFNLGDISDIKTGPFGSTLHQKDYVEIGTPIITVEHLGEVGLTSQNLPLVSDEDKVRLKSYMLDEGDLAFSRVGSVDRCAIITGKEKGWLFSGRILRVRPNKKLVHSKNLMYALKTEDAKYRIRSVAVGQTMPSLNTEILKNFSINLSNSVEEQTKIASFLSVVDEKISQLTQKHGLLSQFKQGMMQKLFSQQIRFKADDGSEFGEWEETELGKHCQIKTGKLDANAMRPNGEFRFYTCAKEFYLIDEYAFDTEALLISGNGANVGYIHYYKGKFNAYQRTYVLDQWQQNIIFIQYFLEQFLKERIYGEKKEGNTPYIVLSTLSEMPLLLPCLEEQTKIAKFLSAIDQKIEVVAQQIEQAKQWKKGLLQQMFI